MHEQRSREPGVHYQIVVKGELPSGWDDWFGDFEVSHPRSGTSLLDGRVADQTALFGLLTRLHTLNLSLLSVARLDEQCATRRTP